jgi:hypothetical protein
VGGVAHQWGWGVRTPGVQASGGFCARFRASGASRVHGWVAAGVAAGGKRAFESTLSPGTCAKKTMRLSLVVLVEMRMPPSSQHQDEIKVARAPLEVEELSACATTRNRVGMRWLECA